MPLCYLGSPHNTNIYTLLCVKEKMNKDLLCSTGDYIQYLGITYNEKNLKKNIYVCVSAVATGWKRSVFFPIPRKGKAKECSNYCTIVLILHTSKVTLNILQAWLL